MRRSTAGSPVRVGFTHTSVRSSSPASARRRAPRRTRPTTDRRVRPRPWPASTRDGLERDRAVAPSAASRRGRRASARCGRATSTARRTDTATLGRRARQQDGALHLGAGHLGVPVHGRAARAPYTVIGSPSPRSKCEPRAHRFQRPDDAPHRALLRLASPTNRDVNGRRRRDARPSAAWWCRCCRSRDRVAARRSPRRPTPRHDGSRRASAGTSAPSARSTRGRGAHVVRVENAAHVRRAVGERRRGSARGARSTCRRARESFPRRSRRVLASHRSQASSAVATSVFSSRYFTITGACSDEPLVGAPARGDRARAGHHDGAGRDLQRRVGAARGTRARLHEIEHRRAAREHHARGEHGPRAHDGALVHAAVAAHEHVVLDHHRAARSPARARRRSAPPRSGARVRRSARTSRPARANRSSCPRPPTRRRSRTSAACTRRPAPRRRRGGSSNRPARRGRRPSSVRSRAAERCACR